MTWSTSDVTRWTAPTPDRFCLSKLLVSYDTDLEKDLAHAALNDEQADA